MDFNFLLSFLCISPAPFSESYWSSQPHFRPENVPCSFLWLSTVILPSGSKMILETCSVFTWVSTALHRDFYCSGSGNFMGEGARHWFHCWPLAKERLRRRTALCTDPFWLFCGTSSPVFLKRSYWWMFKAGLLGEQATPKYTGKEI